MVLSQHDLMKSFGITKTAVPNHILSISQSGVQEPALLGVLGEQLVSPDCKPISVI